MTDAKEATESDFSPFATLADLAPKVRSRAISPVALTEALLARIEQHGERLHAFRLVDADRAMALAQAAEAQIAAGQYLGPLHGIPYATKDLFNVAGLPTTAGSRVHEGEVPSVDASVTAKLARAGMVLLGKTNTVEFAFGSVGINHSHGTPHNPWASEPHVPGGSSSGSAVAVASGLVPVATGTDTACSVRTPAALCGIVGLKTTVGRISRAGVYPLSTTLDSVGPLARCVEDVAWLFDILQGEDRGDPVTMGVPRTDVLRGLHAGVAGLRIAFAEGLMFEDVDAEVEASVRDTRKVFDSLGARVRGYDFGEAAEVMALPNVISLAEGYAVNAEHMRNTPELLDPVVRDRMAGGADVLAVDYLRTMRSVRELRTRCLRQFDRADVLLAPTTSIPARPVAEVDTSFENYMSFAGKYLRNCMVGNLLDLCGISVPCGYTAAGLPIGLMIYGRPFDEATVLRVAYAFEQATWRARRTPSGL